MTRNDLKKTGDSRRRILLVDCDAFFVQVARLEDPDGAGRQRFLIVGGSAAGRGVVTSASYAARRRGVRSAMPTARALRLCPEAAVVPVPRRAVARWSRRVSEALRELAPVVQPASVDEFYLDLTGTERLFGTSLAKTAEHIRRAVRRRTGVVVSIGGGTRRLIAKLATGAAKPDGAYVVAPGEEGAFLRTLKLSDIPGIGPGLARELAAKGLVTVESAWGVEADWFRRWFGERRGAWLHRRIRGVDDGDVDPTPKRESISSERTFGSDVGDDEELLRRLLVQCGSVAATLRSRSLRARTVTTKIRDYDFRTRQASRTLTEPVESDDAVYRIAAGLLADLRERRRVPARLLGVGLGGLVEAARAASQLALFPTGPERPAVVRPSSETETDRRLARAADELRTRFGQTALLRGSVLDVPASRRRRAAGTRQDSERGDRPDG